MEILIQTPAHPMLFTAPMVRAIIAGQKTQTRRLNGFSEINKNPDEWHLYGHEQNPELIVGADKYGNDKVKKMSGYYALFEHTELGECYRSVKCPYGQPGDLLWVRETWAMMPAPEPQGAAYIYAADFNGPVDWNWRPSIHMPRAASRITLQITDIRAQRLHHITEADAIAEGVATTGGGHYAYWDYETEMFCLPSAVESFSTLWQTINGPHSWQQNHWAFAITFKKI